jgi:hypothetical protein
MDEPMHSTPPTEGMATAYAVIEYLSKLNGITFDKKWWTKIVNDTMSPEEIFAIDNIEHRRIAYEMMDKTKMKQLKDLKNEKKTNDN